MDEIKKEISDEWRKELRKEWEEEQRKNPDCDPEKWWEERRLGMKIFLGFLMGIGIIGLIFLFGGAVMLLWNRLMPELFGLNRITYWQAWGLFLLCSLLFKDFPSGCGGENSSRGDRRRKKELRKMLDEKIVPPEEEAPSEPKD